MDELFKDFMHETRDDLKEIRQDVKHLMRFRWMVMGGAVVSSAVFGTLFKVLELVALARGGR